MLQSQYGFQSFLLRYAGPIVQHASGPVKTALRTILEYGPKDGYRLARQECHGKGGSFSFFEGHCELVREIHANAQLEENPRLAIWQAADLELSRHGININSITN